MEAEPATSLRRGLDILLALGGVEALANGGLGVVRLAELTGSDKSRVSRTLKTLDEYRLVERDPDTLAYRLGWTLFTLARGVADARLLEAGGEQLKRLVSELEEASYLSILAGPRVLTVLSEASVRTVQATGWVGRTFPAHMSSAGRALLLDHDRQRLGRLFEGVALEAGGPNAPRTLDQLFERIVAARSAGFALADEESEAGLVAIGAPVRDFSGRIVAAVNVSAPKFRFAERLEEAGPRVKEAADEVSRRLGWAGAPASHEDEISRVERRTKT
jgi:DNA-binding IclR family transcriptional regulator